MRQRNEYTKMECRIITEFLGRGRGKLGAEALSIGMGRRHTPGSIKQKAAEMRRAGGDV